MTTELIQWEYKIEANCLLFEPELNHLGNQGWELVAVIYPRQNLDGSMIYYFKRPIITSPDKQEP